MPGGSDQTHGEPPHVPTQTVPSLSVATNASASSLTTRPAGVQRRTPGAVDGGSSGLVRDVARVMT